MRPERIRATTLRTPGLRGAFVAAIHDYLERELKYESTGGIGRPPTI